MRKLFFFFFLSYSVSLQAQYRNPYFNVLSVENGLPEGYVRSFLQDKLGYMWLGTQNGLVLYDGYRLKKYPLADEKGSPLLTSSIDYIYEDSVGKIWVTVSSEGIYYLDRQKDAFYKVKLDEPSLNAFKENALTKWLPGNRQGSHWLLTINKKKNAQLFAFDSERNTLKDYSRTNLAAHPKVSFLVRSDCPNESSLIKY